MKRSMLDVAVGVFVLLGILALGWLSVRLGKVDFFGGENYTVTADFPTTGGLKNGSSIEIAGVEIGRVTAIQLANYQARVVMSIRSSVKLTEDSIASIKTRGLIGEKFLQISPGGSDRQIKPNGKITEVEPPIDLEELLSKYVFGKV
jgi:phospholipid/cholesterol/gamma-HCH transport system substrate-binding protein